MLKAHAAICSEFSGQLIYRENPDEISYVLGWFPIVIVSRVWCDTEAVPPPAITPLVIVGSATFKKKNVGSAIWMSARHCIISSLVAWHKLFSMVGPIVAAFEVDHLCFWLH